MSTYDWSALMQNWNSALLKSTLREHLPAAAVQAGWLGKPGATEAELTALEGRLGKPLPPSYREFLRFSNGWHNLETFIDEVFSAAETDWFRVLSSDWLKAWDDIDGLEHESDIMFHALQISSTPDVVVMLLNPQKISADGEWQAVLLDDSEWMEYPNFWEMMQAQYNVFVEVDRQLVQRDQQAAAFSQPEYTPRQKIQTALAALREQIKLQNQLASTTDAMSAAFPQGILIGLRYAEEQLATLEKLPDDEIPTHFQALLLDLSARHNQQSSQGKQGVDLQAVVGKIMSGSVTMNDVTDMMGRLGMVSSGEGYLRVLQILQRVRF